MGCLQGKVAVITGAGRGIGRAQALLFAAEGARVVVNDLGSERDGEGASADPARRVVEEIVAAGGEAVASGDSIASRIGAEALFTQTLERFGRVDVLVNNAGIRCDSSLLKMREVMWSRVLLTHLTGTFLCTQLAARQMIRQGQGGRIVNTTSVAGLRGNFGQTSCAAAKAGVYGLTRNSAIELQKHRITVNALAPIAKTRLTEDLPVLQGIDSLTPEHVAPAALFLASPLCGDRTGHVLAVSGSRLYAFKVVEAEGKFKDAQQPWTAAEIAEHWDAIVKL